MARPTPTPPVALPVAAPTAAPIVQPTPAATDQLLPGTGLAPIELAPPRAASPPAVAVAEEPVARGGLRWLILGGIALVVLAALGGLAWFLIRRRNMPEFREIEIEPLGEDGELAHAFPPTDAPVPRAQPKADIRRMPDLPEERPVAPPINVPPPSFLQPKTAPGPDTPRASLELTFRPMRAGTNLTSAAVDYEIDLRNAGTVAARGIRLDIRLLSASADQDAILDALFAEPIGKPAVAPFDLDADTTVSLGGMAMLPREALSILSVQGKAFYVPVLAINALYHWEPGEATGGRGQTAIAFVVGLDRGEDQKMAPFRVDTGARMHDGVAQRPHGMEVRR